MEDQYQHEENGQQLRQQDLNLLGETSALADDRVLWELLRLLPGDDPPQKGVIPYGVSGWQAVNATTALVWGNTADALVHVNPFRAVIGSRTEIGDSPAEHLRGARSAYLIGATTLYRTVAIGANATGNPRWTLIYATVTPDADGDTETVLVKDPDTKVVAPASVVITKRTTVTISFVDGTPAATPTRPALPSDGGGSYHIALAYIVVPAGFGAASTVRRQYIHEVAPCLGINSALGVPNMAPANQQHVAGGTVDANKVGSTPTGPDYYRPGAYLPSTMVGGEQRTILLERGPTTKSHLDGDVVDDSIDWRFRYFKWTIQIVAYSTQNDAFASDRTAVGSSPVGGGFHNRVGFNICYGLGQSFMNDEGSTFSLPDGVGAAVYVADGVSDVTALGTGEAFQIYVSATTGALIFAHDGTATAWNAIIWLEATGPYSNFNTYEAL